MTGKGIRAGPSLEQRLAETEATLAALLSGQIDAVIDPMSHTPVLLSKAQEALRESEERYRRIFETSSEAIWTFDVASRITFSNRRLAAMLGYDAVEMVGKSFVEFLPRTAEAVAAHRLRLQRSVEGLSEESEIELVGKDGSGLLGLLKTSPIRDADGKYVGTLAMMSDKTRRKQAEDALRSERDRSQRYLDTADVVLLGLDLDGRITLINRKGCDLLGRTERELIGADWFDTCVPSRVRHPLKEHFGELVAGDVKMFENPVVTRTGEERLIQWRNTVLQDADGHVVATLSSGTDITDRNQAIEALRTGEERMRFALEAAGVGIWDLDYKSGVFQWSEILESQYGMSAGTFGGTFEEFISRVHPEDSVGLLETWARANASGKDFSIQNRAIWSDGTVRWLSGAGRIHLDERGAPVRGVGVSMDVTERRMLEDQYQQAQRMEAIGRLAGGVAHDFNNLLTVILGYCEVCLADLGAENVCRQDVIQIQKAGLRAAGLTRQLLAFSRKQILEPKLLDLNSIVADVQPMLARLIGEDVRIVVVPAATIAPVNADAGQLEQIVINLAVNARDAMPKGGTLTIAIALAEHAGTTDNGPSKPGPYVVLTVSDTGSGMTPDVQAHLFEPFFTTKEVGKGTGLGLATVHGIASRSGGSVQVRSELGKGSSFDVYLPKADGAALVAEAPIAIVRPERATQTVLVVDDADDLRTLARILLERQGFTVLSAADAEEAVQLFDQHPSIDVLLTDVVMPGTSGPELTRQLVQRRPSLKVIYMSGYTDDAIVHHGILNPGIAFLHKPFTSDTLRKKIREVLDEPAVPA